MFLIKLEFMSAQKGKMSGDYCAWGVKSIWPSTFTLKKRPVRIIQFIFEPVGSRFSNIGCSGPGRIEVWIFLPVLVRTEVFIWSYFKDRPSLVETVRSEVANFWRLISKTFSVLVRDLSVLVRGSLIPINEISIYIFLVIFEFNLFNIFKTIV